MSRVTATKMVSPVRPDAGRVSRRLAALTALGALVLAVAFAVPLGRALVAATVDALTGTRVAFDGLAIHRDRLEIRGLIVTYEGELLATLAHGTIRYDARAAFAGTRRFGLAAIDLERPALVIRRRGDGSFALPGLSGSAAPAALAPSGPDTRAPWRLVFRVRDGSLALVDPGRALPASRRLAVDAIAGGGRVDSAALTAYRLRANVAGAAAQPVELAGRIDRARGYAQQRVRAASLALAPAANYFINSRASSVRAGTLRDIDVRLYGFGDPLLQHVAGSGRVADATLNVPGLAKSARALNGRLDVSDAGIASPGLTGHLGALPIRLAGGIFDWQRPAFRLGVRGRGDLADVRTLFAVSRTLPLHGAAEIATLVEGRAEMPVVATSFAAPAAAYRTFPLANLRGRVIYAASALDLVGIAGAYGGLAFTANGSVVLGGPLAQTALVLDGAGAARRIPYLAQTAPGADVRATALVAGDGLALDARGVVAGGGGGTTIAGAFHVDPQGDGAFGPLAIARADGADLAGTLVLQRRTSESAFWLDARDYPVVADPRAVLPGLALAAPLVSGRLSGSFAGAGPPSAFRIAGRFTGRDIAVGGVRLDAVSADVAGGFGNVRVGAARASGPWGHFAGTGAYDGSRLALQGDYAGDFARLATFTGPLGARGEVAGPVALLLDGRGVVVQTLGARTPGASLRGLALAGIAGTAGVRGGKLHVYAATGSLAGGPIAAAGTLDAGNGIGLSIGPAAAGPALAIPHLRPGRIAAIGVARERGGAPVFSGGATLAGGTLAGVPLAGNGDVTLGATRLALGDVDAAWGGAVLSGSASVAGLGRPRPQVSAHLHVAPSPLGPLAQIVSPGEREIVGTVFGDLDVRGDGRGYLAAGTLAIPEGNLAGLNFSAFRTSVRAAPNDVGLFDGGVTVGSTRVAFTTSVAGNDTTLIVSAPHGDLADFDELFDDGDTLAGRGHVSATFIKRGREIVTDADIAIAGLRLRRFDLGDSLARWTSSGRRVRGRVAFGGDAGTLRAAGTLTFPGAVPLAEIVPRSRFDGTAAVRNLDLGVWLPAIGAALPIGGRVDADATIAGSLRDPNVRTIAQLRGGRIGTFPVDRLEISAVSSLRRTTIDHADLELPSVSATGSGSFGLGDRDPIAFGVHFKSGDVGALADHLGFDRAALRGTAEADLKIAGTRSVPQIEGGFDLESGSVRGVAIPQAIGEFSLRGRDVVLSGVEVGFTKGRASLAGSLPLVIAPFGFGPAAAPIDLDVRAQGLDLADFAPLVPGGSVAGSLSGRLAITGTAGRPALGGSLDVANGSIRTPFETIPLTAIAGRVTFDRDVATLERLHALGGGGTLDLRGSATVPSLASASSARYRFAARATKLVLNLPAYGAGQLDGRLTLAHENAAPPRLAGTLALSNGVIPFSALLVAGAGTTGGATVGPAPAVAAAGSAIPAGLGDLALDLDLRAADNVRVRSANVDIGARGGLAVAGTAADPRLQGQFVSSGGTLTYVNTVFRLLDGTVSFDPNAGLVPTLDAHAITHVIDPDPNAVRNSTGSADITLGLSGPVTNLTIALSSDPSYGRQQILGLLLDAPALGATNLFGETSQSPTFYGSTSTTGVAPGVATTRTQNGQLSVAQEAFGIANAQFTRTLLAPIETTFAGALGLSNIDVNVDLTGNVGLSARKPLGKKVNAIYATSFGYPYRQTFGFDYRPSSNVAAQVTVFQTLGAYGLNSLEPVGYVTTLNSRISSAQPSAGSVGFSIGLQRFFP